MKLAVFPNLTLNWPKKDYSLSSSEYRKKETALEFAAKIATSSLSMVCWMQESASARQIWLELNFITLFLFLDLNLDSHGLVCGSNKDIVL